MLASPGEAVRARRRTTKAVNYAKEQDFSDSDLFEDSDDSAPVRKKSGRGRPRKSDANEERYSQEDNLLKSSKPVYTERGYDPSLPPIRERFPFMPEYEPDGSPRIDLIIGRRPIDEKEETSEADGNGEEKKENGGDSSEEENEEEKGGKRKTRRDSKTNNKKIQKGSPSKKDNQGGVIEYEYLIKYKGRSYLHLEWKTGADLESMNKSAKGIYRRYLKKVGSGDEDLEDPNFDPSYAIPQKIVDEAQQEMTVELTDKELLKWEKERAKELAAEKDKESSNSSDSEKEKETEEKEESEKGDTKEESKDATMEEKKNEDGKT